MNTKTDEKDITEIKNRIEDYESTIQAGQSFISLVTWDNSHILKESKYSFGRRMSMSDNNYLNHSGEITPDIVIQRSQELGYVVEIKKSLPKEKKEWEEIAKQIIKYDNISTGWWNSNEKINTQCVILLIHISRSVDFRDYFITYITTNNIHLKHKVSIVEFSRADERVHNYLLRKQYGEIENPNIDQKLYSGIPIPIEKVVASYGNQKFYDSEPPCIEYTMAILWQDIFNSRKGSKKDTQHRAYIIELSLSQLTEEMQKLYGATGKSQHDVEFPQESWIRKAMEGFVDLGLAKKLTDNNYRVFYKYLRQDPISYFANSRKRIKSKQVSNGEQLSLFSQD
ncbi:MAG: hypothetical protein GYA58_13980 [Anaerolineaceae bacterium]|nr:hypothetical protein [Anaerolineaceae bacterium]